MRTRIDSYCVLHASDASNQDGTYGIEVGLSECGNSTNDDCHMTSHTLYKYVEIQQGAFNYTCFAHGTASLGTIYDPMALTDGYGTTWYAYIGSTAYESNSFAPYFIAEMAEHTGGSSSCSGWSADGMFAATGSNWQWSRYVQSTRTWKVVQSSDKYWVRLDDFWDDPRTVFDL